MAPDDQVIVLGDESDAPPARPEARTTNPALMLVPVVAIAAIVVAVIAIPRPQPEATATPDGLEAPADPPSAFVRSTTTVPVEQVQFGGRRTGLNGSGVVWSIDHGPDGWLAVSEGEGAVVAHASENAVLWRPSSIQGLVGSRPIAVVGDGTMAVVASSDGLSANAPHLVAAVSSDLGESWTLVSHTGRMVARDVAAFGSDVYVAGAIGDNDSFAYEGTGTASLWVADPVAGILRPIELQDVETASEAFSIADTPEGPVVFGVVNGTPARWSIDGRRLHITTPDNTMGLGFVAVEPTPRGLLALIGSGADVGSTRLWESEDGFEWVDSETYSTTVPITDVSVVSAHEIYGATPDGGRVFLGDRGVLGSAGFPGVEENSTFWITSVESANGISVFGGITGADPALFIEGTTVHPVEVAPTIASGEPRWRNELTIDLGIQGLGRGDAWPLATMTIDGLSYVVSTTNVFELDTTRGLIVQPVFESPSGAGTLDPGEIWIATPTNDGTDIHIRSRGADWETVNAPVTGLFGVGRLDGRLVVTGWANQGIAALELSDGGDWVVLNDPPTEDRFYFPSGEGFLQPATTDDGAAALFSRDLQSWEPIEGWVAEASPGGEPILRSTDDPGLLAFPDALPKVEPIEVPDSDGDVRVWRWGGAVAVQDPWSVNIRGDDGNWTTLPIDIEHGVTGTPIFVPGDVPRLAMFDGGLLSFLVWR